MRKPARPLFLERRSYRQRRLMDAARLLPVLGIVLWAIPLLWAEGDGGMRTSAAILYIFGVWLVLAGLAGIIARNLDADDDGRAPPPPPTNPGRVP